MKCRKIYPKSMSGRCKKFLIFIRSLAGCLTAGISIAIASLGVAAPSKKASVEFYYTLPHEINSSQGWAYIVPECQVLTRGQGKILRKCQAMNSLQRSCQSTKKAVIENAITKRKAIKFLIFQIFTSRSGCESDRGHYLSSE